MTTESYKKIINSYKNWKGISTNRTAKNIISYIYILVFCYCSLPIARRQQGLKKSLQELINPKVTFETFIERATLNPNAQLITGLICGYRVEEIGNQLTKKDEYLNNVIDELTKAENGKTTTQ